MKKISLFAAIIICAVILSMTVINFAQAQGETDIQEHEIWTVRQGDTLWSIANAHRGKTEVRAYIYRIQKLNDIGSNIYPGQQIKLP